MFSWKWNLSELKAPDPNAPTVFSTFACGGGSSMGYKRAGYNVLGCCEIDPKINAVYKANLHPRLNYVMDLRDFNQKDDLPEELYNLDVLDGSPPCSTFSMAGQREKAWGKEKKFTEGQKFQRLDDLFFVFLDTVEKLRPKVVIAENVDGITKGNAKGYVSEIIDRFHSLGYRVQLFRLNAKYADVPQSRTRVFFIATKENFKKLELNFNHKQIKFSEVRSEHGIPLRGGVIKSLIEKRRPGDKDLSDISKRVNGKNKFFTHVLCADDQVAPTITARPGQYRMVDGDDFSISDYVSVSSFPQDYDFLSDKKSNVRYIVGMSVPPNLMANIALQVKEQWLDG